jgi:HAE1 family hydrophobic/amphiphilic exporter-1
VVDDAIVMLENIVRHMEMGKAPMQAAFDGSKEIAFTILSMTLALTAVFIPVLFMGGIVGRLLHEFAVTISVAILVSGFVSISLTPMLCSRFLTPPHSQRHGSFYNATERVFDAWRRLYDRTLRLSLRFHAFTMPSPSIAGGHGNCFCKSPRASCPVKTRAASTSPPKRCRESGSTTWSGTRFKWRTSSPGIPTSEG